MHKIKILPFICTMLIMTSMYAGPFGIEMGMKIKDIDKNAKKIEDGLYKGSVPKPHKAFDSYILATCPSGEIYSIQAFTKEIKTSSGEAIKTKFNSLEQKLIRIYGQNLRYDFLKEGSSLRRNGDWMAALATKDRTLISFWSKKDGAKLANNIAGIELEAVALSLNKGLITLNYQFNNAKKCIKERQDAEDSSL